MGYNQIDFALEKPHDKTTGGIRMSFFFIVFFIGAVVVSFLSLVGCSEGSMTKIAQADLVGEWCYSSLDGKPSRTKIEFKSDGTFIATDLHGIVLDVNAIDLITAGDWTVKSKRSSPYPPLASASFAFRLACAIAAGVSAS
jgi:hypothetical protein